MAGPTAGSILRFGSWDSHSRTANTWRLRGGMRSAVNTGDTPLSRNHPAITHRLETRLLRLCST